MSGSEYLLWSYGQFEKMTFFPPDPLPERNSTLDNWKNSQLSIGCNSLDAKIAKEIEEKERGTV